MTGNSNHTRRRVLYGTAVHSKSLDEIEYLKRALVCIDESGVIAHIERDVEEETVLERIMALGYSEAPLTKLEKGEFLLPG